MKSTTENKLVPPVLVLGAFASAGLVWVSAASFHANLTVTPDIVASDAALQQAKGVWFERWWMGVQEAVKRAE